ncbi:MAG: hypothetical protein R3270_11555 [Gammaproteobacteria bacterium]|nr:hypothetical protein [Gammaproteobacteria bacterium]
MIVILRLLAIALVALVVVYGIAKIFFYLKARSYWSRQSTEDLEAAIDIKPEYFHAIDEQSLAVQQFKELVKKRDWRELRREWPTLRKAFIALERNEGTGGPPRVDDYYSRLPLITRLLEKRSRQSPTKA